MLSDNLAPLLEFGSVLIRRSCVANPWETLFLDGKYKEAAHAIQQVAGSEIIVSNRLWWIEAEIKSRELPLTVLCSPFDEIFDRLQNSQDLCEGGSVVLFAGGVCIELSAALITKGNTRLAVILLRRCFAFLVKFGNLPADEQIFLRDALYELANDELNKAKLRQEKRDYIDNLANEIGELGLFKPAVNHKACDPHARDQSTESNTFRKGQKNAKIMGLSSKILLQQAEASGLSSNDKKEVSYSLAMPVHKLFVSGYFWIGVVILVLFISWRQFAVLPPPKLLPPPAFVSNFDEDLELPEIEFLEITSRTFGEKAMDSIKDRIENAAKDHEIAKEKEKKSQNIVDKEAMDMAASMAVEMSPAQKPNGSEDNKNEIIKLEKDEKEVLREKAPPLDAGRLHNMQIEDIGSSNKKISLDKLRVLPDGRRYGPSIEGKDSVMDPQTKEPVMAYEVQQFNPPVRVKIIVDTVVLSAPSAIAVDVGKVFKGDKVETVSLMGDWLEISSLKGKRGYIRMNNTDFANKRQRLN